MPVFITWKYTQSGLWTFFCWYQKRCYSFILSPFSEPSFPSPKRFFLLGKGLLLLSHVQKCGINGLICLICEVFETKWKCWNGAIIIPTQLDDVKTFQNWSGSKNIPTLCEYDTASYRWSQYDSQQLKQQHTEFLLVKHVWGVLIPLYLLTASFKPLPLPPSPGTRSYKTVNFIKIHLFSLYQSHYCCLRVLPLHTPLWFFDNSICFLCVVVAVGF